VLLPIPAGPSIHATRLSRGAGTGVRVLAARGSELEREFPFGVVTPKTVEVHLSNAYRKLGIRSRRELAGASAGG
jgi:hypothetical protein